MKFVKITKRLTKASGFYAYTLTPGQEINAENFKTTDNGIEINYLSSKILLDNDEFEFIDREVICIVMQLYVNGVPTNHYYHQGNVPDIRELGYDIEVEHEFKLKTILK